jgi:uncharacterized membrane-anchored protein
MASAPSAPAVSTPVEKKVFNGGVTGIITGMIAWILVSFVPGFKSGLPPSLATMLPYIISAVGSVIAAYWTPHTPREQEIMAAAANLLTEAGVALPAIAAAPAAPAPALPAPPAAA